MTKARVCLVGRRDLLWHPVELWCHKYRRKKGGEGGGGNGSTAFSDSLLFFPFFLCRHPGRFNQDTTTLDFEKKKKRSFDSTWGKITLERTTVKKFTFPSSKSHVVFLFFSKILVTILHRSLFNVSRAEIRAETSIVSVALSPKKKLLESQQNFWNFQVVDNPSRIANLWF